MQDCHVTYREVEASLGISSISIHSILHEHLAVKKICSRWLPHNLQTLKKWFVSIGVNKCWKKYDDRASKDVYKIVTGAEIWIRSYEPETVHSVGL